MTDMTNAWLKSKHFSFILSTTYYRNINMCRNNGEVEMESLVEIKGYSVAYFNCIAAFEASYC